MIDPDLDICTFQTGLGLHCGLPATQWFRGITKPGVLRGRCPHHIFRYNTLLEISREEAEVIAVMQS